MHRVVALTALAWGLGHMVDPESRTMSPQAGMTTTDYSAAPAAPPPGRGFAVVIDDPELDPGQTG